jgi:hypothetical protein
MKYIYGPNKLDRVTDSYNKVLGMRICEYSFGFCSSIRVEPSISVKRNVTVPVGRSGPPLDATAPGS